MNAAARIFPATWPATSPAPRADFPDWVPPMLVKELRQKLRARGFVVGMVFIHVGMAGLLAWALLQDGRAGRESLGLIHQAVWFFLGLVLLVPPRQAEGLLTEMKERTSDLLLLTQLDSLRIVLGKWVALLAQAALLAVGLLPYWLLQYFLGRMELSAELPALAAMLFASAVLTAVALMFAVMAQWQGLVVVGGGCIGVFMSFALMDNISDFGPPSWWAMLALAIYDAPIMAALALVLAAWRLDPQSNRSRTAGRIIWLTLPAAIVSGFSSGALVTFQVCFGLGLFFLMAVVMPSHKNTAGFVRPRP